MSDADDLSSRDALARAPGIAAVAAVLAVPPLILLSAPGASKRVLSGSVALPEDVQEFDLQP